MWSHGGITLTWIGHSTFLINLEGTTILTDPVFSEKVGVDLLLATLGPAPPTIVLKRFAALTALVLALAGCLGKQSSPQHTETPTQGVENSVATPQELFTSSGGGEPRSGGYWVMWSTCGENSQAAVAAANGGREAGWIILDDLLADPGILVGDLQVETCQRGVNLLQGQDLQGNDRQNDPAYTLAAELMTAQLNLAVGSEDCTAANQAVQATQLLLLSLSFNGTQGYLGPPVANQDRETALFLADQLAMYNSGELCVP